MIEIVLDGLRNNAEALFLIAALFAGLMALFIVLAAGLRLLEWAFPSFARWLDAHTPEGGTWD